MGVIRVALALAVVVGHAGSLFGYVFFDSAAAVQCFYVISGFYMALVLDRTYATGSHHVRRFYISRYFRLAPTYWVVMLATLAAALVFKRTPSLQSGELSKLLHSLGPSTIAIAILVNLLIVGQDAMMFLAVNPRGGMYATANFSAEPAPAHELLLVPQAWSLGVELLFYALAPYLMRRSAKLIAGVALASIALRIVLAADGLTNDPWKYRFFPTELATFLVGSLAYRAYRAGHAVLSRPIAKAILGGYLAALAAYAYVPAPEPVKRFATVLALAFALPSLFALTKDVGADNYIGRLSYPIYISHVLLMGFARYAGRYKAAALIVLSIATAMFLVWAVEDPVDRWRTRLRSRQVAVRP